MLKREELLKMARHIALHAYCPYSHFHVGCALLAGDTIFTGVNVEISSYGHTLCAERAAIATAISAGCGPITEIAISCIDVPDDASVNKRAPCRTCRQWLSELAPNAVVYIDGSSDEFYVDSEEWRRSCSRCAFFLE